LNRSAAASKTILAIGSGNSLMPKKLFGESIEREDLGFDFVVLSPLAWF
jgi:hypothetical protein